MAIYRKCRWYACALLSGMDLISGEDSIDKKRIIYVCQLQNTDEIVDEILSFIESSEKLRNFYSLHPTRKNVIVGKNGTEIIVGPECELDGIGINAMWFDEAIDIKVKTEW